MDIRKFLPNEDPDESIYIFVRPYFLALLPTFALEVALILIGVIMILVTQANFPDVVGSGVGKDVLVIMSSMYFLTLIPFGTVAFLDYYYDIHIVTDHRVVDIDQRGLFNREINELDLRDVQDVSSYTKGILSSVFDFGDVIIETAGSQPKFDFNQVRHPSEIAGVILDLSSQAKQLENQAHVHLEPQGEVKGVIHDTVLDSTAELKKMGAMAPEPIKPGDPAPPNDPAALPKDSPVKNSSEPKEQPAPPAPPKNNSNDDLDITIDDPVNTPKKG